MSRKLRRLGLSGLCGIPADLRGESPLILGGKPNNHDFSHKIKYFVSVYHFMDERNNSVSNYHGLDAQRNMLVFSLD